MKAATALLLLIICLAGCQQQNPNTSTKELLVLQDGWTFHPADSSSVSALPVTGWSPIQPMADVYLFLEQHPAPVKGWLSNRFTIPQNWASQQYTLTVLQSVASEIYLDKQLIAQYGIMGDSDLKTREHDPLLTPIPINVLPGSTHTLDVKIALAKGTIYTTLFESPNPLFQAEIKPINSALEEYTRIHTIETGFLRLNVGINIMLFVVHFMFFLLNRGQVANLFLSFSALAYIFSYLLQLEYFLYTPDPTDRFYMGNFVFMLFQVSNWFLFLTIHTFLDRKKDIFYWFLVAYFFAAMVMNLFWYDVGWRAGGAIFQLLTLLNVLRICVLSIREKKKGAAVFLVGALISITLFILFIARGTFDIETHFLRKLTIGRYLLLMSSWVSITGAVSAFLAWDFSLTSKQLALKLAEVRELSDKNVAIEKEKQEILASQNLQLEQKVQERTQELNQSLKNLRATQAQLIQSEKMASLGELTAGIAHEIQNPLNFVNNFAEVNTELISELSEELRQGHVDDAGEIAQSLLDNEQKILYHGKRADAIVKGMLQHSRSSSGVKELTDLNALAEEYIRLASMGMMAKNKNFNVEIVANLDPLVGAVNMIAQDIGRVFLNLLNNAFYAVQEKQNLLADGYVPRVEIRSVKTDGSVLLSVSDNGMGIPASIREKIFQPFFTTKPTGSGTGLGLSLSYDIVKAHGGEIIVNSTEGEGSEFKIIFPLN